MTMPLSPWDPAAALAAGPAAPPEAAAWRRLAARALRAASRMLDLQAARLAAVPLRLPELELDREFYAQAGAPEGALYVNGQLVGLLPGVNRL